MPPLPTPELPHIKSNMNPAERVHTKLAWQAQKAGNKSIANMNEALLTTFLAAIQPAYKKSTKIYLIGWVSNKF